jgi:hypothetical protein
MAAIEQPEIRRSRHHGAREEGSSGDRARLDDDDRRSSRAPCGVAVELLVQFAEALRQLFTLGAYFAAGHATPSSRRGTP